ncbi:MAG: DUF11 domain-containing protein [Nitrospirae bacterium]|nr:DUF11 domain-containing protein [Nitrospirota bacterium]
MINTSATCEHRDRFNFKATAGTLLFIIITAGLFLFTLAPPVVADTYPPVWGSGTANEAAGPIHFAPAAWPGEPADPVNCGVNCGDWKPYTRFQSDIADPRVQDPSNGGTAPQNYVNIASSCIDKTLPSIYYYLYKAADPKDDVIFFRWRVEQIANNYATGPSAGSHGATDPWSSALWSVLFDVDGDGYLDLAAHLDGSSGAPATAVDRIAGIWSMTPTQSLDYLTDLNVKLIAHNPTAFTSGSTILNFHDNYPSSSSPNTTWPSGDIANSWDYGTTRAKLVSSNSCNEYFVDYQIPVRMLDASSTGPTNPHLNGPKITRSTPISMIFCTANSLNNPFQKDCALRKAWIGAAGQPAPFGDYLSFDQTEPYSQPIVSSVTASAPSGCPGSYSLTAKVQDTLAVVNGVVVPSVKAVDFYYWYDANGDGDTTGDIGSAWTKVTPGATLTSGTMNTWTASWDASGLPKGKYLIGVQAVDDNTKVDDGVTPSGIDNRTFSYVVGDASNRIYIDPTSYVTLPAHSPAMTPGSTENWYGNPAITGTQTALVGVALNNCGKAPTITKSVSNANPTAGSTVDFTLTITNELLTDITLSQISDVLPAGFSFNSNQAGGTLSPSSSPSANATGTITWTFPNTTIGASGGTATLIFRANVTSVPGTYSNTATATASFGTLMSDPVQLSVGTPRLTISKTPSTFIATPGSTVTYTITYSNDSPANTTGVTITDTLPTGLTYVSSSCTGTCTYTSGTRTIDWTIGSLASGEGPYSVTFQATVDNPYTGAATNQNTATIKSPQTTDASSTASVYVDMPRPLLTLKKTAGAALVAPGSNVTFTLAYTNSGNATSSSTVLSDPLPSGFTYVSATGSPTSVPSVGGNGTVTWTIGSLAAGASGSVTVTVQASNPFTGAANPATNTASISSTQVTTPVTDSANVGVTQSGSLCSNYYFHSTTTNVGNGADGGTRKIANITSPTSETASTISFNATTTPAFLASFFQDPPTINDVNFSGNISTSFYVTKSSGPQLKMDVYVYDYNPVTGTKTSLGSSSFTQTGSGTNQLFTFTLPLSGTLQKDHRILWWFDGYSNNITTMTFNYDGTASPSGASFCVTPPANLILEKSASAVSVQNGQAGQTITYTLNYANTSGSTQATNVVLSDILPAGTTYASSSPAATTNPGVGNNGTVTWDLGTVAAGGSGSVTVTVNVDTNLSAYNLLTNTSSILSDQTAAVTATASTTVLGNGDPGGTPNVIISKQASDTLLVPGNTVTYTLTAVNAGNKMATGVVVTDNFPDDTYFTYGGCSTATGACSETPSGTLTWNLGTLAPGGSAALTFTMTVGANPPSGVTTKDNTASLTYSGGGVGSATSNTVTVSISTNPNLSITKEVAPLGTRTPGDTLTYTLTIVNNGTGSASDVVVTDPIPSNTGFKGPITASQGTGSFDAINNRVVFSVGTLAAGAGATLGFEVTVNSPLNNGATSMSNTNTATVSSTNAATRQSSVSSTASASPVLSITKSGPTSAAYPAAVLAAAADSATTLFISSSAQLSIGQHVKIGIQTAQITGLTAASILVDTAITAPINSEVIGSVTYDLLYQNTGNANSTSTIVTDTLPSGPPALTYFSVSPAPTSNPGVGNSGDITWNLGTLAPGASGTLHVIAFPSEAGTVTNSANIDSAETSPVTDTLNTIFGGLTVSKSTSTPTMTAGSTASYSITVTNSTSSAINNVDVKDLLPSGFTYKTTSTLIDGGAAPDPAYEAGDTGRPIWTVNVPANGSVTIAFQADIASSVGAATYQNGVELTAAGVGITPFDPLLTTAEDVTILASNMGILNGYVYRRNDSNTTFNPGIDTPFGGVKVMIEKTSGDCSIPGSTTCYIVYTDTDGYYSRVLPAGDWIVTVVGGTGDLPGSGISLVVGTNPETVTVPNQGSVSNDNGYSQVVNLGLSKTDGVTTVTAGGTTTYTLTVSNSGNTASSGTITVVDVLPSGLTVADGAVALGGAQGANWSCSSASNVITCTSSTAIAASGSSVFSFTVNVSASASGTVVNKAQVGGGGDPTNGSAPTGTTAGQCTATDAPNEGCATDSDTVNVAADLDITKTGPGSATSGSNLSYTVAVKNIGPSNATNVVVTDPTPGGLTFVSAGAPCAGGFPCAVGTITSGGTVSFTVTYSVPAGYAGADPIVNAAAVSSDVPDPDPTNNSDSSSTAVDRTPSADLALVKTGPATAALGSMVTYKLVVTNNGPDDALGVNLSDPTPAGLSFVSATAPCSGGFPCDLGTVNAGASVTVNVTYGIPGGYAGGTIINSAEVASTTSDPVPANNEDEVSTPIGADTVDLAVVKTGPAMVVLGSDLTYQIKVTNNGPAAATGISLADPTPSGLSLASATAPCSGGFPCSLSNLASGASTTVNVTYNVPGGYAGANPIVNTATVSSTETDSNTGNNTGSAPTGVGEETADLSVVKTGPSIGVPGEQVTFQIVVTNNGPGTATGITLNDITPTGLTFVSASSPCNGGFDCNLGTLVNGSSITVNVTYGIPGGYTTPDPIVNTTTVSANEPDPNSANNTDDAQVGINNIADLSITKTDGVATVTPGGSVTYTITASNAGPSSVTGATVADTFPASLTATWTCVGAGGGTCTASGSGNISDTVSLPSGGSVTYTVSATISASATGTLSNTATVTAPAGVTDPTPGNNSATDADTISIVLLPDLTISKSHSGNFSQGQIGAQYTITVSNQAGSGAVSNAGTTVAVTDTLPLGLTPTGASGTNWACGIVSQTVTCTRSAANNGLNGGASYPAITVTVNVAANAAASLDNTANVALSGQTESSTGNNSDTDPTVINVSNVFDPPSGFKTVNPAGYPELEWKMVWINSGNAVATLVRVTDDIPSNVSYVPGSLQCTPRGTSTTVMCAYDSANRRITWQGNIGTDPGAANEAQALNEVVITYRTTVPPDVTRVENRGCANWDTNGNGSLDEINLGQTSVCSDDPGTPPSGDDTVWTKQDTVVIPTLDEWGMIIFILLAGLVSIYNMRRKART